jgi:hypothetical protein
VRAFTEAYVIFQNLNNYTFTFRASCQCLQSTTGVGSFSVRFTKVYNVNKKTVNNELKGVKSGNSISFQCGLYVVKSRDSAGLED